MNNVELVGRLARDPELRYTSNGIAKVNFTLVVDRKPNKDGEVTPDFIRCMAWNKTAEFVAQWFKKGKPMAIIGQIRTGSYEKEDGTTIYTTDVLAEKVEFVPSDRQAKAEPEEPEELEGEEIQFNDNELPF